MNGPDVRNPEVWEPDINEKCRNPDVRFSDVTVFTHMVSLLYDRDYNRSSTMMLN